MNDRIYVRLILAFIVVCCMGIAAILLFAPKAHPVPPCSQHPAGVCVDR